MASLLKNVSNSILHAFNALQQEKPGFVNKSKLKVNVSIFGHIFNFHIFTFLIPMHLQTQCWMNHYYGVYNMQIKSNEIMNGLVGGSYAKKQTKFMWQSSSNT